MGAEPVIRRKSGVALRLPPHSIDSRDMSDSFPQPETGWRRSIFQGAKVSDQCLDIRIIEFCAEPGHFAFDTFLNDSGNSGIRFAQVVEARPLIAARVIAMAMRAIVVKQAVAQLGFALHAMTRGCGNDVG